MVPNEIKVNDIPMKWWEAGDGPPVIYVHGIPTSPALWRHVIKRLPNARNLALEMIGYGDSIPAGKDHDISVAQQAEYLVQWMEAMDLEQAHVVGHDLGGGVAQILAMRYPERVRSLVLVNSICYDSWPIPAIKALRAISPVFARMPNVALYLVLLVLMSWGHDNAEACREALRIHWSPYREADGTAALARQMDALDVRDTLSMSNRLSSLDRPARIVWGAADLFQTIKYGERLARDLNAPIDRIDGGKHFVPEDHPDRVASAISKVMEGESGNSA